MIQCDYITTVATANRLRLLLLLLLPLLMLLLLLPSGESLLHRRRYHRGLIGDYLMRFMGLFKLGLFTRINGLIKIKFLWAGKTHIYVASRTISGNQKYIKNAIIYFFRKKRLKSKLNVLAQICKKAVDRGLKINKNGENQSSLSLKLRPPGRKQYLKKKLCELLH